VFSPIVCSKFTIVRSCRSVYHACETAKAVPVKEKPMDHAATLNCFASCLSIVVDLIVGGGIIAVAALAWAEQRRVAKMESSPALMIQIEPTPWEIPADPGESMRRWRQLSPEQKFKALLVTNKGRGPATLVLLCYAKDKTAGLDNAHLPLDVSVSYPCEGFIQALVQCCSKECYVVYRDPHGQLYHQWFRVNLEHMTAAPLHLEKVSA
jgi:hypothetical protein